VPSRLAEEFTETKDLIQAHAGGVWKRWKKITGVSKAVKSFLDDCEGPAPTPEMIAAWDTLPKPERKAERDALAARWEQKQAGDIVKTPKASKPRTTCQASIH
jgi:hypothetical protein